MKTNEKKKRIMAIAAAGALAILLASSLVRCAVTGADNPATENTNEPAIEQTTPTQQPEQDPHGPESSVITDKASTLNAAMAVNWIADDGSGTTLQITDKSVVEKAADGTLHALAYSSADESYTSDQALVRLTLEDGSAATLIVTINEGKPAAIASDSLTAATRYVAKAGDPHTDAFEVEGLDERYLELIGGNEEGLTQAIANHTSQHAPQASAASFDGEVYLDLGEGLVSATFHLNDNASTIVTVLFKDGAFEIL